MLAAQCSAPRPPSALPLIAHCSLLSAHRSPLTAHRSPLSAQCSAPRPPLSTPAHCSPLPCSLPTAQRSKLSRRQSLDQPFVTAAPVSDPVMKPGRAALPELDNVGHHSVAAPVRRARDVSVAEACFHLLERVLELLARSHDGALRRCPRAEAAAARARGKVEVRLGLGELLRAAFHPHLSLQLLPPERQRHTRIRRDIVRLSAVIVRVEGKTTVVDILQQHHTCRRPPIGIRC